VDSAIGSLAGNRNIKRVTRHHRGAAIHGCVSSTYNPSPH